MKVVILCGGKGMRLREETELKPKPMIEIGGMPILWHIMKTYAQYGFHEFVLCLGYKGEVIKEFFYNYEMLTNDFTIELGTKNVEIHPQHSEKGWKVTLVDTGLSANTGARIKRIERFVDGDTFMVTYGDGLTDLDVTKLVDFHKAHGKIGTVTGVSPDSRYGELHLEEDRVLSFQEKPKQKSNPISGGYFVFHKKIFDYLKDDDSCILERDPLRQLSLKDDQLRVFRHDGFWQCMDTFRDYAYLKDLWQTNKAKWKVW